MTWRQAKLAGSDQQFLSMQPWCQGWQGLQDVAQSVGAALLLSNVANPAKSNVWYALPPPAKLDGRFCRLFGMIP